MYLEISARRTGKTERLIQAVEAQSINNRCVVIPFSGSAHQLYEKLYTNTNVFIGTLGAFHRRIRIKNESASEYKHFFDEFDWNTEEIPLLDDGYYVTTPKYIRKEDDLVAWNNKERQDSLLSLMDKNNYQYIAYVHSIKNIDNYRDFYRQLPNEMFNLEFGAQLFSANIEGSGIIEDTDPIGNKFT